MKHRFVTNILIAFAVFFSTAALTFFFESRAPKQEIFIATPLNSIQLRDAKLGEIAVNVIQKNTIKDPSPKVEGLPILLTDYKDKIILLNFWASWCAPCVVEFPSLLNLAKKHKDDIVLIALSSDNGGRRLNRFLKRQNQDLLKLENVILAWDKTGEIRKTAFDIQKMPETLVIDKTGNITHSISGSSWDEIDISRIIQSKMDEEEDSPKEATETQYINHTK